MQEATFVPAGTGLLVMHARGMHACKNFVIINPWNNVLHSALSTSSLVLSPSSRFASSLIQRETTQYKQEYHRTVLNNVQVILQLIFIGKCRFVGRKRDIQFGAVHLTPLVLCLEVLSGLGFSSFFT